MTPTPKDPVDALMALVRRYAVEREMGTDESVEEARAAVEASARALAAVPAAEQKTAPVQGWPQGIPWSLHLEAYAAYCAKWGAQPALIDLEGRNCRGGFGTGELDMFIPGWRERVSEITALRAENAKLRADIAEMVQADADSALAHMQPPDKLRITAELEDGDSCTIEVSGSLMHLQILDGLLKNLRRQIDGVPHPEAVQPLSEAQIEECWDKRWGHGTYSTVGRRLYFARAIEAAHGIVTPKEPTP